MGDSSGSFGFHTKTATLLNNTKFSDVEIHVEKDDEIVKFHAHTLFLSMHSQEFENMFYGSSDPPKVLKICDHTPNTVYLMLEYIYANKLDISTEEARQLYTLAKKFGIRSLQEYCVEYISKYELKTDNVLYMYECALREEFKGLLRRCRNVVSVNTKAVLESPTFVETTAAVLKDIFQLESLAVESELDVLTAAIKWSQHECKRNKLSAISDHLRQCIYPFFLHLRFLTLTADEFSNFVAKYNVLNALESSLITRKLLQPNSPVSLPKYLCAISRPRHNSLKLPPCSTQVKDSRLKSVRTPCSNAESLRIVTGNTPSQNGTPSHCIKINPSSISGNNVNRQSHLQKLKIFEFPLHEMQKLFSTAFNNDVKCDITLNLHRGRLLIYGIELKINQESNSEEIINVILNVSTSSRKTLKSSTYIEKLQKSALKLNFSNQPLEVVENVPVKIEVMIEDLKLNRCSVIKNPCCKLNHESNIIADLLLTSNQTNKSDYFFLISRLIYSEQ